MAVRPNSTSCRAEQGSAASFLFFLGLSKQAQREKQV